MRMTYVREGNFSKAMYGLWFVLQSCNFRAQLFVFIPYH